MTGTTLDGFKPYLSGRFNFVHVNDASFERTKGHRGVPEGSVLGPILFTLYMLTLGIMIKRRGINFHCYTNDTQLYLFMKPDSRHVLKRYKHLIFRC